MLDIDVFWNTEIKLSTLTLKVTYKVSYIVVYNNYNFIDIAFCTTTDALQNFSFNENYNCMDGVNLQIKNPYINCNSSHFINICQINQINNKNFRGVYLPQNDCSILAQFINENLPGLREFINSISLFA